MEKLSKRISTLEHRTLKAKPGSEAEKLDDLFKEMAEAEEQMKQVARLFITLHPEVSKETSSEEIERKLEFDGAFIGEDQKSEDEDPETARLLSQCDEMFKSAVRRDLVSKVIFLLHNPKEASKDE